MNKEHRELLRRNRSYIRDNVANLPTVLDKLHERGVLSVDMMEEIGIETKSQQAYKMLDIVPKRGSKAFDFLIESLIQSENEEVANHLMEGNVPDNTNYTVKDISQPKSKPEPSTFKSGDLQKKLDQECNTLKGKPSDETKRNVQEHKEQKNWIKSNGISSKGSDMIKSTDQFYEEMNNLYQNDLYHMVSQNKGTCFLLFTHTYPCSHCRDHDKTCLQLVIKNTGFAYKDVLTFVRKDFNKSDIQSELQKKLDEMKAPVCGFVLIAVTSGKDSDRIHGTGGESDFLLVSEVIEMLKNCSVLNGKPKVILLLNVPSTTERCLANEKGPRQSESVGEQLGGAMACLDLHDDEFSLGTTNTNDIYVVSCTPTVGQFLVQGKHGSYFSYAFAHCFQIHAHKEEFLQLMQKLDHTLRDEERTLCCYSDGQDNLDAKPLSSERRKQRLAKVKIISRPEKKKFFIFPGFDGAKGSQAT